VSIGARRAEVPGPQWPGTPVAAVRGASAGGPTWRRRVLLAGLFLVGLWGLLAVAADAAQADTGDPAVTWAQADAGDPATWAPDAPDAPHAAFADTVAEPPPDTVVPPDAVPVDPPAKDADWNGDKGRDGGTPVHQPDLPPPDHGNHAVDLPAVTPPVVPDVPPVVPTDVVDVPTAPEPAAPPADPVAVAADPVAVVPAPEVPVPLLPVVPDPAPVVAPPSTIPVTPTVAATTCSDLTSQTLPSGPVSAVAGAQITTPADGSAAGGGAGTASAASAGAPLAPALPVAPPPLPQPPSAPAPAAPACPSSATASGASASGSGNNQHPDVSATVLDAGGASLLAGSSVRSSSGFPGAVVGGADDPGDRPD
jgi:hypothetical protein